MALSLALAVGALGNRAWGDGTTKNWIGVALMVFGVVLARPEFILFTPLFVASVYLFRAPGTGPNWLAATRGEALEAAALRGLYCIPHFVLLAALGPAIMPIIGLLTFWLPAVIYYLCGKQKKVEPVALAECLVGAWLVLCSF